VAGIRCAINPFSEVELKAQKLARKGIVKGAVVRLAAAENNQQRKRIDQYQPAFARRETAAENKKGGGKFTKGKPSELHVIQKVGKNGRGVYVRSLSAPCVETSERAHNINTISIVANKKVRGRRKAAQGKANVRLSFGPSR